jgi:hypothetical protein
VREVLKMKVKSLFALAVLGVMSGCVSDGCLVAGCFAGQQYSAELSISKTCEEYSSMCGYNYTLTNSPLSSDYIDPELRVFVSDCDGNTIEEETIYFDTIFLGKKQTKSTYHYKSEDGFSKVNILTAESGWEWGDNIKYLKGVHGMEYNLGCS